eukprot:scaffold26029_cov57-Phaeocystis_antarctica.AAC.2
MRVAIFSRDQPLLARLFHSARPDVSRACNRSDSLTVECPVDCSLVPATPTQTRPARSASLHFKLEVVRRE